jgi:hypothetical protein
MGCPDREEKAIEKGAGQPPALPAALTARAWPRPIRGYYQRTTISYPRHPQIAALPHRLPRETCRDGARVIGVREEIVGGEVRQVEDEIGFVTGVPDEEELSKQYLQRILPDGPYRMGPSLTRTNRGR